MKRARFFGSMMRYGAVAAAVLAIAGCGGGGGDGDSGATIDVTAANKDALARAAVVAIQWGLVAESTGGVASGSPSTAQGRKAILDVARRAAMNAVRDSQTRSGREAPLAMVDMGTDPCAVSGSVATTLDDQNGDNTVSLGETITVVHTACRDEASEELNGTFSFVITNISPSLLGFTADFNMSDFAANSTTSNRSVAYTGGFTATYEESPTTATLGMRVGNTFAAHVVHPQLYEDTVTLQAGYTLNFVYDANAAQTTARASGKVASQTAGGTVTLRTRQDVVWNDVDTYAHAGIVEMLGKTGSVTVTALPNTTVQIDFDQGDGGAFEDTDVVTWDWF
jgi:hypothetical protein